MTKASDNLFPKILADMNTSSPAAPSDRSWKLYAKANGIYARSSNSEVGPFGAAGSGIATDTFWAAQGDIAVATGNDAASVLTKGATNTVLTAGASTLSYVYPPGYQYDYAEYTSGAFSVTATSSATANTVITGNAVSYDGSTRVCIEFFSYRVVPDGSAAARFLRVLLYDGSTELSWLAHVTTPAASTHSAAVLARAFITPSNASHTYSIRAYVSAGTGTIYGEAGGSSGISYPAYLRITKA